MAWRRGGRQAAPWPRETLTGQGWLLRIRPTSRSTTQTGGPMSLALSAAPLLRDRRLDSMCKKVQTGQLLTREDGILLFETADLHGLGLMADFAKRRLHGEQVFFVLNRYINPTNLCVLSCAFCDFARKKGEDGAFENSIEDVLAMIKPGTREAHIVGGHHPDWPFEYYERMIEAIHAARPETQIKAFTAAEIDYFWRRWKIEPREALGRLKKAGLHSMPGGGAEVFSPRLQKLLKYSGKADADRVMIGEETASVALHFGASDVNGTLEDEKIAHMALAESPAGLATEQILRMIRDAGKVPVERDALYNVVKVWN